VPLSAGQLKDNRTTVSNIRLWRPSTLEKNFAAFQRVREYYDFLDVDVDRYPLGPGGTPRVIMVSAREMNQAGIPAAAQTWQNTHLVYTHGFGAVAAQVNTATIQGQPVLTLKDLPPTGVPTMTQPRICYGETDQGNFVVAGPTASSTTTAPRSRLQRSGRDRSTICSGGRCSRGTSAISTCCCPTRSPTRAR
jgi:uncharacterized membrane protein (UPF0182 family)